MYVRGVLANGGMGVGRKVNPTNCRRLECLVGFVIKADVVGTAFANEDIIVLSLLHGLSDILPHERLTWKCWNWHVLEGHVPEVA